MALIPKIFHRVWLDEPVPERWAPFWDKLQELHPDWEFKTWGSADEVEEWIFNKDLWRAVRAAAKGGSEENRLDFEYGSLPDILRYELMAKFGGVYIDVDFEPLKPFEPITDRGLPFIAWESRKLVCCALMGGPPEHPAFLDLIENLEDHARANWNKRAVNRTGPYFITNRWVKRDDVLRLPPSSFFPVCWDEKERLGGPYPDSTYAVHWWNAGWVPDNAKRKFGLDKKQIGVEEPEEVVTPISSENVSVLIPFRDDGNRLDAKNWVQAYWEHILPDAEIVFGTDDGDPFSKSTAVNDAFMKATGDILVVCDADTFIEAEAIRRALRSAAKMDRLIIPWNRAKRLTQADSEELMKLDPDTDIRPFFRGQIGPSPSTAGMLYVINRRSFEQVNGMDPRFRGWGWEDVMFGYQCLTLLGPIRYMPGRAFALWHPVRKTALGRTWGENDPGRANLVLKMNYSRARGKPAMMKELIDQHPLGEEPAPMPDKPQRTPRNQRVDSFKVLNVN